MRRILQHIMVVAALSVCLLSSCGRDETEVIPRGKLARIYAEMLMTDQWITSTSGVRLIADTSFVYQPILEKYGYDIEDYLLSVDHYMDDPERFARIFRTSGEIMEERLKELRKIQHRLDMLAKIPKIRVDYDPSELAPYLSDEPYVKYYDSLAIELDSAKMYYRLVDHETSDTTYEGIRMVIREAMPADSLMNLDSLAVADSLARVDSLAVADSLAKADSILKEKNRNVKQIDGRLILPEDKDEKEVIRPQYKKRPVGKMEQKADKEQI